MELEIPFEVLWADTDASGLIYHAAALRYVAQAETALFRNAGFAPEDTIRQGYAFPRVHVELDSRSPLRPGDRGAAHVGIGRIGNSSIRLDFRLTKSGEVEPSVEGHVDMVLVNMESGGPIPVPEDMRSGLTTVQDGQRRGKPASDSTAPARPGRSGDDG